MTEAEWLGQAQPQVMLTFVCPRTSDRKLRLLGCAEFRLQLRPLEDICDEHGYDIVRVTERYADGQATADELAQANGLVRGDEMDFDGAMASFVSSNDVYLRNAAPFYLGGDAIAWFVSSDDASRRSAAISYLGSGARIFRSLIRCIFGNPFRPVAFSPAWRTTTAVALAAQMYESRDFSALPILADALQDAGCDIADVLEHCCGPGPHVRGCWVVDLVLGKE